MLEAIHSTGSHEQRVWFFVFFDRSALWSELPVHVSCVFKNEIKQMSRKAPNGGGEFSSQAKRTRAGVMTWNPRVSWCCLWVSKKFMLANTDSQHLCLYNILLMWFGLNSGVLSICPQILLTTFHFGNYQLSKEGHWATDWYKKQVFIGIIHTLNFFFLFFILDVALFWKRRKYKRNKKQN